MDKRKVDKEQDRMDKDHLVLLLVLLLDRRRVRVKQRDHREDRLLSSNSNNSSSSKSRAGLDSRLLRCNNLKVKDKAKGRRRGKYKGINLYVIS